MSDILREAAINALNKAYEGYLNRDWDSYQASLSESRKKIEAIRGLGKDPDRMGRDLEVLYLSGEEMLITAFAFLGKPDEMYLCYELAEYYFTVLSSRILTKDTAFLPPDIDLIKLFPLPKHNPEKAMDEFSKAMDTYRKITGGGDGVDELYRAALACQQGDFRGAKHYVDAARSKGEAWILPHADRLDERLRDMA